MKVVASQCGVDCHSLGRRQTVASEKTSDKLSSVCRTQDKEQLPHKMGGHLSCSEDDACRGYCYSMTRAGANIGTEAPTVPGEARTK